MANAWRWLREILDGWRIAYLNVRQYDAPRSVKLRLFLRNNLIKMRTLSLCCGNLGEPGC